MSEFRDYVYVRIDPATSDEPARRKSSELAATRAHLKTAREEGFNVHRRDAVTERIGAAVAVSGRPQLMRLIRKLGPDTALIVRALDGLGRDAADVLKTIKMVKARGAEIHCLEISIELDITEVSGFVSALEAVEKLDNRTAAEHMWAQNRGRSVAGGRLGRPRSLDEKACGAVLAGLAAGDSIASLARRFNTSRQTILRVREAQR